MKALFSYKYCFIQQGIPIFQDIYFKVFVTLIYLFILVYVFNSFIFSDLVNTSC